MSLSVLNIAYPFAPVRSDTAGGAEQILLALDRGLKAAGHRSIVVAQEGSQIAGDLVAAPCIAGDLSPERRDAAHALWRDLIAETTVARTIDVVHMHGIDFQTYLPPAGIPTLATLHLPIAWYTPDALRPTRPRTCLHCVSASQARGCDLPHLLPPIENGVDIPLGALAEKDDGALMLTRICPEKGVHLALDAARLAGMPLTVAGSVFAYPEHQRYFDEEVRPRLDDVRRFVGPVGGAAKQQLLARARCLLVASTVEETSSLAAREALAAGTPVVAFARGALVDTIDHGRTGFLVDDVAEMAEAMKQTARLDPAVCRDVARERFSAARMIERYLALYERLASPSFDRGDVTAA